MACLSISSLWRTWTSAHTPAGQDVQGGRNRPCAGFINRCPKVKGQVEQKPLAGIAKPNKPRPTRIFLVSRTLLSSLIHAAGQINLFARPLGYQPRFQGRRPAPLAWAGKDIPNVVNPRAWGGTTPLERAAQSRFPLITLYRPPLPQRPKRIPRRIQRRPHRLALGLENKERRAGKGILIHGQEIGQPLGQHQIGIG